jgi:hypothetical protein
LLDIYTRAPVHKDKFTINKNSRLHKRPCGVFPVVFSVIFLVVFLDIIMCRCPVSSIGRQQRKAGNGYVKWTFPSISFDKMNTREQKLILSSPTANTQEEIRPIFFSICSYQPPDNAL